MGISTLLKERITIESPKQIDSITYSRQRLATRSPDLEQHMLNCICCRVCMVKIEQHLTIRSTIISLVLKDLPKHRLQILTFSFSNQEFARTVSFYLIDTVNVMHSFDIAEWHLLTVPAKCDDVWGALVDLDFSRCTIITPFVTTIGFKATTIRFDITTSTANMINRSSIGV